jgi:hypothetical protein
VTFPAAGCYRSSVAYQAAYADTVVVRVRVVDGGGAGTPLTAHYTLSDGWGFGWGPIAQAAGSGPFCVARGTYDLFLEHESGGNVSIDYVEFDPVESAVEPTTWGSIKALYR